MLLLAATAITTLFITQAQAENRAVGSDGIAASPKLRQMINEHGWSARAPFTVAAVSKGEASCCKATPTSTDTSCPCCQGCQQMTKTAQPVSAKK
jgi:hypothetical protein